MFANRFARPREMRVVDFRVGDASSFVVREDDTWRELVEIGREELVHTRVRNDALVSGFAYTDAMHVARALTSDAPVSALCLGAGGGIVPQQLAAAGLVVDVVERSRVVLELAAEWFGLEATPLLSSYEVDAADFIATARGQYDLVVVDLFGAREAAPLVARNETFARIRGLLRPEGVVCVNTIGRSDGSSGALRATELALSQSFDDVLALPLLSPDEASSGMIDIRETRNVVLFGAAGFPERLTREVDAELLPAYADAAHQVASAIEALASARHAGRVGSPLVL